MTAKIIQFVPKSNPNRDVLDRIHGIPANRELPTTEVVGGPVNVPPGIKPG